MTDIYSRLKEDHDRQRKLLKQIAETEDHQKRRTLFEGFVADIEAHAAAEEQSFYAGLIEKPETSEEARHSVAEHKEIDDYIETLQDKTIGSEAWMACFLKLRERYEHHIDEEEQDVFPEARKVLSDGEESDLGNRFDKRKAAELEQRL